MTHARYNNYNIYEHVEINEHTLFKKNKDERVCKSDSYVIKGPSLDIHQPSV